MGLATGSSPLSVYQALRPRLAGRDLSRVRGFALDEYVGIDPAHPESYRSVIHREVIEPLGLNPELIRVPNGDPSEVQRACGEYDDAIRAAGGIDLQILGLGTNGHIGFNEQGSSFASRTRLKTLTEQTRRDNARFFNNIDEVPRQAVTQGIGTILEARHLVLLAFGKGKAAAFEGQGAQRGRREQQHIVCQRVYEENLVYVNDVHAPILASGRCKSCQRGCCNRTGFLVY